MSDFSLSLQDPRGDDSCQTEKRFTGTDFIRVAPTARVRRDAAVRNRIAVITYLSKSTFPCRRRYFDTPYKTVLTFFLNFCFVIDVTFDRRYATVCVYHTKRRGLLMSGKPTAVSWNFPNGSRCSVFFSVLNGAGDHRDDRIDR